MGGEVIALFAGEVEEFLGEGCGDGVVAWIVFARSAVAVAEGACHGLAGEEVQRLVVDCVRGFMLVRWLVGLETGC